MVERLCKVTEGSALPKGLAVVPGGLAEDDGEGQKNDMIVRAGGRVA